MTTFNATGASIDSLAETRAKIAAKVRERVRQDMNVDDEDSVIGKFVTIAAETEDLANQKLQYAVAVRDPTAATGTALKRLVLLDGIDANEGLYSTVALTLTANAEGTKVYAGDKVNDPNDPAILWALDSGAIIAPYGSTIISATCETLGAVNALAGTLTEIKTPRQGWATVTNAAAASPGQTADTDPGLRQRRTRAARSFGKTTISGVWSALEDIDEVTEVFVHQNLGAVADSFGVAPRTMLAFIRGGNDDTIAEILYKTAPIATQGDVATEYVYRGQAYDLNYSRPTDTGITIEVFLAPTSTSSPEEYSSDSDDDIKEAIRLFSAANQKMGIDAIPQQFAGALSGIVPGYYVDHVEIDGAEEVVSADMGEALVVEDVETDVTVTIL